MPALSIGRSLQLTAIAGRDMKSTVECWTFNQALIDIKGMKIQLLGDLTGATYTEIPAEADLKQGPYNAPALQFFTILEGNATITFPTSDEVLHVKPSKLYIAADNAATSELGHHTVVRAGSRLLQFPFKDGVVPEYTAVKGECDAAHAVRDEL
ncbi:hypothetical protein OH76DRAFT_1480470 [Lentinus brumalis]|uniref:Uncharacterized protein n=1 Tax=Lentinus brumalis TaxID=2498619 RepID=A0A371DK16_9APHY|nr:hypothetical protein OH76DRAFT_1480470 [Polyporus brumalis]